MHENSIIIQGAQENNLKNMNIEIPKGKIIVFTGVSGSGKSSLVFDTIAAESQRQLNELYPTYIRARMQRFDRPKVELIKNLSPSIVINQKPFGGNSRSTVGTATDIQPFLRLLFSRIGEPSAGVSTAYSFNDPLGMCPECSGLGKKVMLDINKLIDHSLSLSEGAIMFKQFAVNTWQWQIYANSGFFDVNKKLCDYSEDEMTQFLYGEGPRIKVIWGEKISDDRRGTQYEGLSDRFNRLYLNRELSTLSEKNQSAIISFVSEMKCPKCLGKRLNNAALLSKINGMNIADFCEMEICDLIKVVKKINNPVSEHIKGSILSGLWRLNDTGLGYLHLNRTSDSLSGGEGQRVKMVRHLGSSLTGMTYVLDEPSAGLHSRDLERLCSLLIELRDLGNSVLVVEHDREIISIADQVIDIGPLAGENGGKLVFQGSLCDLKKSASITGKMLNEKLELNKHPRIALDWFEISDARKHNLKNINIKIPKNLFCAITGVAGSGKSSLMNFEFIKKYPNAVVVDQSHIGQTVRSTPATYVGVMDDIRKLFSKENNVPVGMFSFNSTGACPVCDGKGEITPEMAFADPIAIKCEACGGQRFKSEVRDYLLNGISVIDVLEMTITEALSFFADVKILRKLKSLEDVGVGYLTLGQPSSTLSGGECQRLKLATELSKSGSIFILDEPTSGLHMADVKKLIQLLNFIVDKGNSVIVIEHNFDVIAQADWIIDLGPDAGKHGGEIVFEGTALDMLKSERSITAQYLKKKC